MSHVHGDRIRREREARSLTRKAFAKAVGVSESSIKNWENDSVAITARSRQRLTHYLGFDLFASEEQPQAMDWQKVSNEEFAAEGWRRILEAAKSSLK